MRISKNLTESSQNTMKKLMNSKITNTFSLKLGKSFTPPARMLINFLMEFQEISLGSLMSPELFNRKI